MRPSLPTTCVAWIQPAAWFLQPFFCLTTRSHAAVWLSKSCHQCVQLCASAAAAKPPREYCGHDSGERKSIALQQLDCVARTMHQCSVLWASNFAQ